MSNLNIVVAPAHHDHWSVGSGPIANEQFKLLQVKCSLKTLCVGSGPIANEQFKPVRSGAYIVVCDVGSGPIANEQFKHH